MMKTIDMQSYQATAPATQLVAPVSGWSQESTASHIKSVPSEKAKLPDGLFPVLMSTLQNSGDAHYHIRQRKGQYHATNSAHALEIIFTEAGVQMRLEKPYPTKLSDITLTRWGYGNVLEAVPKPTLVALDNRIEYQRKTLTEWYLNGPLGLEQGFTLTEPPLNKTPGEALVLELAFSEDKTRQLTSDGQSILWSKSDNSPEMMYGHLYANDATGRELPIHIEAVETENRAAWHMCLTVDDRLAVYPILIDPIIQQAELSAADGASNDQLGASCAISNDVAIVGAPNKNSGSGAAYIFIRNGNVWSFQQELVAGDVIAGDHSNFGASVSVSSNIAIVGSPYNTYPLNGSFAVGSVYIFVRNNSVWTQQQKLITGNTNSNTHFGWSVAVNGNTLVVGEPDYSNGIATVFVQTGTMWNQQAYIGSGGGSVDRFGGAVAISNNTIVVGAASKNTNKGEAYVFIPSGTNWLRQQTLDANDGLSNDQFGASVAINNDTIIIGAPGKSSGSGEAYIFTRSNNIWSPLQNLIGTTGQSFGTSVSITNNTAIVGAPGSNPSKGSATVFVRAGTVWVSQPILMATDGIVGDYFGISVCVSNNTYLIGAIGQSSSKGGIYFFALNSDIPVTPNSVIATNAITAYGTAGASISAGQTVYADPIAGLQIKPAHAYMFTEATNVIGVALNTAGIGQPVAYAVSGDVTFNNIFTPGTTYLLSDVNPGALIPDNLLMPGDVGCVVGIATSPTNLRIHVNSSGVQK